MQSFPFTSQKSYDEHGKPVYDRAVDSTILRNMWKFFFTNGVFPNPGTNFSVIADNGMQIKVRPGHAMINGAICYEDKDRVLTVQAAETNDRIDIVVLRLNDDVSARKIDLYIVKGTAASAPSAPAPTRLGGIYELVLAQLYVSANSSTITQERITDTRLNTEMCGYVNAIDIVDTTDIFNQYQAALNKYMQLVENAIGDTLAGQLQDQIDAVNQEIDAMNQKIDVVSQEATKRASITKAVLAAGATSVTIEDDRITTDSALSFYASIFNVNPIAVSVDIGSVTLTFDARDTEMEVGVRVDG